MKSDSASEVAKYWYPKRPKVAPNRKILGVCEPIALLH